MALNNVTKKIDKARDKLGLEPDEQVLAACMTDPKAGIGMAGGLVGVAVQAAIDKGKTEPHAEGLAASFPAGRHMLAITSKRVIVCAMGAMSGRPTSIVSAWPHDSIVSLVVEKAKLSYPFAISFADGSVAQSEGAKGTGADELGAAAAGIWA